MKETNNLLFCAVCNIDVSIERAKKLSNCHVGQNGKKSNLQDLILNLLSSKKNEFPKSHIQNLYSCTYCLRILQDFSQLLIKFEDQRQNLVSRLGKTLKKRSGTFNLFTENKKRECNTNRVLKLTRVPVSKPPSPDITESENFIDVTLEILDDQENALLNVEFEPDVSDLERKKGSFGCRFCSREFTSADFALEHMKMIHGGLFLKCEKCGAEFRSRSELVHHKKVHLEDGPKRYHCTTCSENFETPELLETHFKTHDLLKRFGCGQCGRKFSSEAKLLTHIGKHKQKPFPCIFCNKTFSTRKVCSRHQRVQHGMTSLRFPCGICSRSFTTAERLHVHIKNHGKRFRCRLCGRRFETLEILQEHNASHSGMKLFVCEQCGKSFAKKLDLDSHARTHTGEKPFQCEICGAMFSQKANLSSHVSAVHLQERRHKCGLCHKSFKRRRLLVYHMRSVHTGDRPYRCSLCSASFVYPGHFKKHLLAHTGIKPYACEICGKKFSSRDNRNTHRFTHSNRKPYECKVCGSSFMRKPALLNHLLSAGHGDPETAGATVKIVQVITDPEQETMPSISLDNNEEWDLMEPDQLEPRISSQEPQSRTIIIPDENGDPVQIVVIDSENVNPLSYYDNFEVIEAIGLQDNFQVIPEVENDDVSLVHFD